MMKKVSALKARQNLGQIMNEVAIRGDDYVIERAGKPLVVIIPMEKYERLQSNLDEFFEEVKQIREQVKDQKPQEMDKLIEEAIKAYRNPKTKIKA